MKSLQNKIFFFFVALIILVQAVVLITISRALEREEQQQIEQKLNTAKTIFKAEYNRQSYYLSAFAETAAKDFGLKEVFTEDTRSFLVALNNHKKRIDADLAIAISIDGTITGELVNRLELDGSYKTKIGSEQGQHFRYMAWLELLESSYLYSIDGAIYQLSIEPLKSGAQIIGWIGFGYSIDIRLANRLATLTGFSTDFIIKQKNSWSLHTSSDQSMAMPPSDSTLTIEDLYPQDLFITSYSMGSIDGMDLVAVLNSSRSNILGAIQQRWQELAILAVITLVFSLGGAYIIAAGISRPVKRLVNQAKAIASGDYHLSVDISNRDELGQLATEFNQMKEAIINREQFISYQAYHDQLTDLPNRNRLKITLEQWLQKHEGRGDAVLLHIRPQRLKDVSLSLGSQFSDQLIVEIGRRLQVISGADKLFNVGSSSFVVFNPDKNEQDLIALLDDVEGVSQGTYEFNNISMYIQLQVGVAIYPQHGADAETLIQQAATAFQDAQQTGSYYKIYDPILTANTTERMYLINGLKTAIETNQLVLYYQPKLCLLTDHVTEVEALVRWIHPERGLIPPDKFIELAEQTGQIDLLTSWVLNAAAMQYKSWEESGIHLPIAINVSAENLKVENFYEKVISTLRSYEISHDAISLEVTESVVVGNPEEAIALLNRFHDAGISMSIDDYGTGYSSLAQIKKLPVSELKVDKAFVMSLLQSRDDQVIVRSTIDLAHNMGLAVVAEGVEDSPTLNWLKQQGCEKAQGFFICRPKPADELLEWLSRSDYSKPALPQLE